jgi:hypothetical protein
MPETPAYTAARQRFHTQPIYLIRFAVPGAVGSGTEYPFSRDFAGPAAPLSPTRNPYLLLGTPSGNTQTVDLRTGASSRGALTFPLLDRDGLITAYCGNPALPLASPLGAGDTTATISGDTSGYPDQGTIELISTDGSTRERARYASRSGSSFLGLTRGVDGTTAQAWPASTPVHNGEQIRPGVRVHLYAGYADLAEVDMLHLGLFEVMERTLDQDRVTWQIRCADVQYRVNVQIFLTASEKTSITLGPAHPAILALRVLLSTGTGTNGPYDVLPQDWGAGVDQALVDVAAFEALANQVLPTAQFQFSLVGPADAAAFVAQQLLWPLGAVLWASPDGRLSVKRILVAPGSPVATLDVSAIVTWGPWTAGDRDIVNVIDVRYDWRPTELPGDGQQTRHDYQTRQQFEATQSIRKYGRRLVNGIGRPHTWAGVRTTLNGQAVLDNYATLIFSRWADPSPLLPVTLLYRHHNLSLGDFVGLEHPAIPNLSTGLRGLTGTVMQIMDIRPSFGREGGVQLLLSTVVPGGSPSGGVFDRRTTALPENVPPTMPSGLSATGSGEVLSDGTFAGVLTLAWTPVPDTDVAGYVVQVRKLGDSPWETHPASAGPTPGLVLRNLSPNTTYEVRVAAEDTAGKRSAFTAIVSATTPSSSGIPTVPTGFTATSMLLAVRLTWNASGVLDLAGYEVQRADDSAFTTNVVTFRTDATFYLDKTNDDQTRWYRVRAYSRSLVFGGFTSAISGAGFKAGATHLVTDTAVITTAAQIANAIIGDAHITNLSANKLTTGILDANRLDVNTAYIRSSAMIRDAVVDRLKLTSDMMLQTAGWGVRSNVTATTAGTGRISRRLDSGFQPFGVGDPTGYFLEVEYRSFGSISNATITFAHGLGTTSFPLPVVNDGQWRSFSATLASAGFPANNTINQVYFHVETPAGTSGTADIANLRITDGGETVLIPLMRYTALSGFPVTLSQNVASSSAFRIGDAPVSVNIGALGSLVASRVAVGKGGPWQIGSSGGGWVQVTDWSNFYFAATLDDRFMWWYRAKLTVTDNAGTGATGSLRVLDINTGAVLSQSDISVVATKSGTTTTSSTAVDLDVFRPRSTGWQHLRWQMALTGGATNTFRVENLTLTGLCKS